MAGTDQQHAIENVAEACADALLTACAAVLFARDNNLDDPLDVESVLNVVGEMLDKVLSRTETEGAKPE